MYPQQGLPNLLILILILKVYGVIIIFTLYSIYYQIDTIIITFAIY